MIDIKVCRGCVSSLLTCLFLQTEGFGKEASTEMNIFSEFIWPKTFGSFLPSYDPSNKFLSFPPNESVRALGNLQDRVHEYLQDRVREYPRSLSAYVRQNPIQEKHLPDLFTSISLIDRLNAWGLEQLFQERTKEQLSQSRVFNCIDSLGEWNVWTDVTVLHGQSAWPQATPFKFNTFGISVGGSHTLQNNLSMGLGLGYQHSWLDWKPIDDDAGKRDALFVGSHLSYRFDRGYATLLLLGICNKYYLERRVEYQTVVDVSTATLSHNHSSFDLELKGDGGYDFSLPGDSTLRLGSQLGIFSVYEPSYDEFDGESEIFKVNPGFSVFLDFMLRLEMRKTFTSTYGCATPSAYLGAAALTPVAANDYEVRKSADPQATMQAGHKKYAASGQLIIGAELAAMHRKAVQVKVQYEARLLGHYQTHWGKLTLDWDW